MPPMLKRYAALLVLLAVPSMVQARQAATAHAPAPTAAGGKAFAADRLARIDTVFQKYVDEGRLAGAVVLVLRNGRPVYERAFGWSDKEAGRRMAPDSIFRIASQSKALTSVGI